MEWYQWVGIMVYVPLHIFAALVAYTFGMGIFDDGFPHPALRRIRVFIASCSVIGGPLSALLASLLFTITTAGGDDGQ